MTSEIGGNAKIGIFRQSQQRSEAAANMRCVGELSEIFSVLKNC